MIPLVNPAFARQSSAAMQPWLRGAVRWIVVLLALVATADAAYLSWTSIAHGVVAGCDGMGHGGCDDVLTSRWSRAAGLPVALGGLLCYGSILVLGLFAGSRGFNANRGLGTLLATAAILAALTGLWFTVLQVFVLGSFCYYCLGIHLCGLVIAGLVLWSALGKQPHQSAASRSHVAMVAAIPGARRSLGPRLAEGPSLRAAAPVAGVLLAFLIAAQVMFPPKTFQAST
ncbi:MAG: vitamin K epoxide reductase family protein, partial [Pirellulales bacterium]